MYTSLVNVHSLKIALGTTPSSPAFWTTGRGGGRGREVAEISGNQIAPAAAITGTPAKDGRLQHLGL